MGIDFDQGRWQRLRRVYGQWWQRKLDRPVVAITLADRDPGRPQPAAPRLDQSNCHDFDIPADALIDRLDYELSRCTFLGDAYPRMNMDCFGPGVAAAFLGARLDNSTGRIWFHPVEDLPIDKIHFRYDPDNPWLKRVREIYTAGLKRWEGRVLMGMTDLGGNLDILATFRPGESLLLDLLDAPDEVKRLTWEAHAAWHQYYADLHGLLRPVNPGYSDWAGIYCEQPSYMLQCDFCYMIGPAMFDEFVKPELAATCRKLSHSFYHLDGKGQLPHLDSLLTIAELDGVQWVPGDGQAGCDHWPEVYRKIEAAGKLMQIFGGPAVMDAVAAQIANPGRIQVNLHWPAQAGGAEEARAYLSRYRAE